MNYEPYMTVPSSTSHTVFFDPLVQYYTAPIRNLPRGAPPDALFTQFFEASQFDSMINRILSDFRYMQKPIKFEDSIERGIVDSNLAITLNTLFQTNNLFYVNRKPYTIVGMNWKRSNWQIDTKPIDKLISSYGRLSGNDLKTAEKDLETIPEMYRQGNLSSSNLVESNEKSLKKLGKSSKKVLTFSGAFNNSFSVISEYKQITFPNFTLSKS
jgi:hypothetical protein